MSVITADSHTGARWQTLGHLCPSSICHSADWVRVLSATPGLDIQAHLPVSCIQQARALLPQLTDLLLTDKTVPDHLTGKAGDALRQSLSPGRAGTPSKGYPSASNPRSIGG